MTIDQHIQQLNTTSTSREQERNETYKSVKEMETTLGLLVVEVQAACVVVTQ